MSEEMSGELIRPEWGDRLRFGERALLSDLVVPEAKETGILESDPGLISGEDVEALASIGLPILQGWISPAIEPVSIMRDGNRVFRLAYSGGRDTSFVADTATGRVLMVSLDSDEESAVVNSSVHQFTEMAWRFYHLKPILFEMQHSGTNEVPFADYAEGRAIKERVWAVAVRVDQPLQEMGPAGFWWDAIWNYL